MNFKSLATISSALIAGGLLAAGARAQTSAYTVTDLGNLGYAGQPLTVANSGLTAGSAQIGNNLNAVLWYRNRMFDIGVPGLNGPNSQAAGVNSHGQAAGEAQTAQPDPNGEDFCGFAALGLTSPATTCAPFIWQNGVMTALPLLGGFNGAASQINDHGIVAGTAENGVIDATCPSGGPQKLQFKPVVWQDGSARELPAYPGDPDGNAHAVNDYGHVAGASGQCTTFNPIWQTNLQPLHALLWVESQVIDLGTLGGTGHGSGIIALNLNNHGEVIGFSDLAGDLAFHGFVWTRESGMKDLGTLPGDVNSAAIGINETGQVVGVSLDANFNPRAFLRQGGSLVDLNTMVAPGSPLFLATGCSINAAGQITGIAFDADGNVHGYLATPNGNAGLR